MMVVLLLYAYCVGLPSSRKIEKACWEDAAFRVLTGNQQPDHSRISDFRRRHLPALAGLFVQVLRLCQRAGLVSLGLVSLGQVALDGTKVKANASKHKAMSHERMLKSERQLEAELLKHPVLRVEVAGGVEAFGERVGVEFEHFTAALQHGVGGDALKARLIAQPDHLVVLEAQRVVVMLQAAIAAQGDDRAGVAAHLKDVAAVDGAELTPHRGEALKLAERLIHMPVAAFGQGPQLLQRHRLQEITCRLRCAHRLTSCL